MDRRSSGRSGDKETNHAHALTCIHTQLCCGLIDGDEECFSPNLIGRKTGEDTEVPELVAILRIFQETKSENLFKSKEV